jgi:ribonuclease VapC
MMLLDASAVLAFLGDEPGSDVVMAEIGRGVIAAPNWSEVVQKAHRHASDAHRLLAELLAVGLEVEPFLRIDAEAAADLWQLHPELSLADRACLAMGARLEVPVLTADRAWSTLDVAVEVIVVR